MKNYIYVVLFVFMTVILLSGCKSETPQSESVSKTKNETPAQTGESNSSSMTSPHGMGGSADIDISSIKKPEGGKTIAEIFSQKDRLSGKEVLLRAKVVKFTPRIMKRNWVHLKDGTGAEGTDELIVTTQSTVKVGDTVLVKGVLQTDRDFGYGYRYDVIIEDAQLRVE